jgi:excisionase family DNA binding protein
MGVEIQTRSISRSDAQFLLYAGNKNATVCKTYGYCRHCGAGFKTWHKVRFFMTTPLNSEWLTAVEAADYLKVKHRTILKWAKTGVIPAHALSGSERITWRFLKSELDAMLASPSAAEPRRVE